MFHDFSELGSIACRFRGCVVDYVLITSFTPYGFSCGLNAPIYSFTTVLSWLCMDFGGESIVVYTDDWGLRVLEGVKGSVEQRRGQVLTRVCRGVDECIKLLTRDYSSGYKVFLVAEPNTLAQWREFEVRIYSVVGVKKDLILVNALDKLIENIQYETEGSKAPSNYEIKHILPCIAEPDKIRVIAKFNQSISKLTPILHLITQASRYSRETNTVTLKASKGELVTVHGDGRVCIATVESTERAREIIEKIMEALKKAEEILAREGEPSEDLIKRREQVKPLEIYKLLPKTNCGECGEKTCMAFAVKVASGELDVSKCPKLNTSIKNMIRKAIYPYNIKYVI